MYENGRGVPKDRAQAIAWFRKAADSGNADAKAALAQPDDRQLADRRSRA
jgi:TPR repeat protein